MDTKFKLYVKPEYNFLHWLNDEQNNYKGYGFWNNFCVRKESITDKGISIDFIEFSREGKPRVAYHYFSKDFTFGGMWNFTNYDNYTEAWRYLRVPAYFNSFKEVINCLLEYYNKKINYLCGQFLS